MSGFRTGNRTAEARCYSKVTKELQSLKEILATKEADFVEEITSREEQLQKLGEKLQQSETELFSLQ